MDLTDNTSSAFEVFTSDSPKATALIAEDIARRLSADCFVALSGDLGAGKTTFVKALAKELGVTASVKSPSFNIYSIYDTASGGKLVHLDAYRLSGAEAFEDLLLDEIVPTERVLCVEWPENISESVPEDAVRLKFTTTGEFGRVIEAQGLPPRT